jgi:hypothetical protein
LLDIRLGLPCMRFPLVMHSQHYMENLHHLRRNGQPSILTDIGCSRTNSERRRIMKRIGNHADVSDPRGFPVGFA